MGGEASKAKPVPISEAGDEEKQHQRKHAKASLPWKTSVTVSLASFVNDIACRPDGTINRRLVDFFDPVTPPTPSGTDGVYSSDVTIDASRHLWARFFLPKISTTSSPSSLPVVVFFHGGGFVFLSAKSRHYEAACRRFARRIPAAIVSVNYRRSPEHRFPAPYTDGIDVLRFLSSQSESPDPTYPFLHRFFQIADISRTFLAGDSAGANIAHHVTRDWSNSPQSDPISRVQVIGLVAIQPFFGGEERVQSELRIKNPVLVNTERTDWLWKAFLPEGSTRDHEAANVFGPKGKDVELGLGFPKVFVVIGGSDPLQDWQWRYVDGLKEREKDVTVVEYKNAIHAFYLFSELPEATPVIDEIRGFIECCSSSSKQSMPFISSANCRKQRL